MFKLHIQYKHELRGGLHCMIDYGSIGQKIRQIRLKKGMTQEEVAEAVGVGVTHISHLETGAGTVSLKVFLAIVNTLDCSADEILCKELRTARPIVNSWLVDLVSDCDAAEIKILSDTVTALKASLRKNRETE